MAQGATRKARRKPPVRRWRRILRAVLGSVAVLSLGVLLGFASWRLLELPVERVIVSGELKQVSKEELMTVINQSLDGGFLWADLQSVREPLEQLPWVYRAVVKRRWPNSLEIRVMEQRAIAHWGDSEFLNHAGEVFSPAGYEPVESLPLLAGPEGTQAQLMQQYMLVQEQLQAMGLQLVSIAMDRRGGIAVRLERGGRLVFGRGDIEGKLQRFRRVYEASLAPRLNQLESVDLRYSHGAAVAWAALPPANNKHKT